MRISDWSPDVCSADLEEAAEGVWHAMLDNNAIGLGLGIGRAGITLGDIVRYDDDQLPAVRYTGALAGASAMASQDRPVTDPDVIGATGFYYLYDRNARDWSSVASGGVARPAMQTGRTSLRERVCQ